MLMDVDVQENNNDRHTSQHAHARAAHGGQRQPQRTDAGAGDIRSEYDDDDFQVREGEGRDDHAVSASASASASAGASDKTVTVTSASPFRPLEEGGGGAQRRLSIRDLLDTSHPHINTNGNGHGNSNTNGNTNGRPGLHSAHSSPGSTGTTASSPRYWNWPVPPSSAAGTGATFNGNANGNGNGAESPRTHSPVPFPPPRSRAPSKRPVPISTGSSPFPYSSVRNSARASASPYPPQATPVGLGIRMDASTSASVAASPSPSGDREHHSLAHTSPGPSPAAVGAGFSSPGGGSLSSNRRGIKPAWPSPKKRDARSQSFGQSHHTQPGSSLLTPREWYDRTPTVLRIPRSAHIQSPAFGPHLHSPSTPVSIPGSAGGPARRPGVGAGWPANSAPAGAARRVHLTDVPKSKVINALNSKAAEYWFSPQTSDCRIYVPVSRKRGGGSKAPDSGMSGLDSSPDSAMGDGPRGALWPPTPGVPAHIDVSGEKERMNVVNSHGRSGAGRRGSMPNEQDVPVLVFPLHRDYLIIQSTLLRTLLSNSSLDMALRTSPTRPSFASPRATSPAPTPGSATATATGTGTGTPQAQSFPTPRLGPGAHMKERSLKGARMLPAKDREPVSVFLPLPDPASFGVILHWLYWGDVGSLEQALSRGLVTWQGIVKNIEYLSMDDSIKRVMGKWWRTWVKTDVGRATSSGVEGDRDGNRTRGVSVSASSEGGDGSDLDDPGADGDDEGMGMQVDPRRGDEEEDGVSDLLKNL